MKILIIDDEELLVKGISFNLENEGYQVVTGSNGAEAVQLAQDPEVGLIVLDVMMPVMDGLETCRRIRQFSSVPIIMLTAKTEDMDKLMGFEYGADDYIPKPFNILEVKARIKALFRRVAMTPIYVNTRNDFVVKDLVISPVRRSVTLKGEELKLSTKELDLLILFASNRGKVFSRSEILSQIWTNEFAGDDRSVDVLVKRLREKIESDTAHPFYILTKWGVGYYFTEQG